MTAGSVDESKNEDEGVSQGGLSSSSTTKKTNDVGTNKMADDLGTTDLDVTAEVTAKINKYRRARRGILSLPLGMSAQSGCLDFTLKLLRLRKNIKPHLREVTVRNTDDSERKEIHVSVIWPCETLILKKKLQAFAGIRADNQRLVFQGRILKDDEIIPDECFLVDSKKKQKSKNDGSDEMVFHIWMVNVGFSFNKYQLMKEKQEKMQLDKMHSPHKPLQEEEDLDEEAKERKKNEEIAWEVNEAMKALITSVEQKVSTRRRAF